MIVEGIWLEKIDDVEPVSPPCYGVLESKVEPLIVDFSIVVWVQNQVVLKLVDLNGSP